MSSWRKDNVPVNVYDLHGKYLGEGTVVWCKDPALVPEEKRGSMFDWWGTPRITMPDGKVIFGTECWWSEVKDTPQPTPQKIKFDENLRASPDNSSEEKGNDQTKKQA